jgi:hypothetical protein
LVEIDRRKAGNQVVELEHEPHVLTAVHCQRRLVCLGKLDVPIENLPAGWQVETANDVQER